MENFLHDILLFVTGIGALFVLLSNNPIHSVLFLILTFIGSASILLFWGAEFIAFIFIIVYVGAIAVLFLFIVMMLNIKRHNPLTTATLINYFPIGIIFLILLLMEIKILSPLSLHFEPLASNWYSIIDNISNTELIGQVLYKEFIICFMLCGILLLIAMLGAIVLTQNFSAKKTTEIIAKQLSRKNLILLFKKI